MDSTYETSSGLSYQYGRKARGKKAKIIRMAVIAGIVILGIIIGLGVLGAVGGGDNSEKNNEPTPSPIQFAPSPTPSPQPTGEDESKKEEDITPTPSKTPTPTEPEKSTNSVDKESGLDRADLSIEIQNGSGITGAASKVSDILENLGYKILSTGNADNFDYEETVIQVKLNKKEFLNLLKSDLSGDYTISEATSDLTDSTADALVIVGKK